MKRLLQLLLISITAQAFGATMSHDEIVVRMAYARLGYASQLAAIGELGTRAWGQKPVDHETVSKRLADTKVTFELSDFTFGNINEVINKQIADVLSPPAQQILQVDFFTSSIQEEQQPVSQFLAARITWTSGAQTTDTLENMSVGDITKLAQPSLPPLNQRFSRYAAYSVTASYQGNVIGPYKAIFFFGKDAKGNDTFQPNDNMLSPGTLSMAMGNVLYPKTFLKTSMRRVPLISEWLQSTQMAGQSCSTWQTDNVCCDLATLKCGIATDVLRDEMAKPLPPSSLKFPGEKKDVLR
jgi:hypothetical protein